MIFIYITCRNQKEAEKIGSHLINKRLLACVNFFPITSIYRWKKKIVKEKEVAILAKTEEKYFEKIKDEVKKIHSYEIPLITSFRVVKTNKEYLDWLKKEIK